MARPRPDFVQIRLSEHGRRMAGEHGVVRWANSRRHFEFQAGIPLEVERSFEWNHLLKHELFHGEPILEEVLEDEPAQLPEPLRTFVDQEPGEGD